MSNRYRQSSGGVFAALGSERNVRIAMVALLTVMLFANVIISSLNAISGGSAAANGTHSSGHGTGDVTGSTDPTDPDGAPVVDTAYGNVVTAVGSFSSLIDRFIDYERSVMQSDEIVLTFTGDCTLGTWPTSSPNINYTAVYNASGSPTYSFDNVKSFFLNDDYTYINLETTLTTSTDLLGTQYYNFKGDPAWAQNMIAASGVNGCNLANNHSYDWGSAGYDETRSVISAAGMDVGDEAYPIVTSCGDIEVVLLSGNYIFPAGGEQRFGTELTNYLVSLIGQYKRPDNIVIVNAHWGLERQHEPAEEQYTSARKFIDAGADMVIGHHPHTLQGIEQYNGKYIFYSLGNFAFGGKGTTDEVNRIALMARPRFALRDGIAALTGVSLIPCYTTSASDISINNYQPIPLAGDTAGSLLDGVLGYCGVLDYGISSLDAFDTPTRGWTY